MFIWAMLSQMILRRFSSRGLVAIWPHGCGCELDIVNDRKDLVQPRPKFVCIGIRPQNDPLRALGAHGLEVTTSPLGVHLRHAGEAPQRGHPLAGPVAGDRAGVGLAAEAAWPEDVDVEAGFANR